jgi:hypothetical protein
MKQTEEMATIKDFESRYTRLNDDFNVITSKRKPASPEQIEQYEQFAGIRFTDDFREFLTSFGQLIIEVKEETWPRPQEMEVLPMWKFGYGFYVFGLSGESSVPEWMNYPYHYDKDVNEAFGQLFFQRSGNLYRAYTNNEQITIGYDEFDEETEKFDGNLYDFLIAEIDKLEKDYNDHMNEPAASGDN